MLPTSRVVAAAVTGSVYGRFITRATRPRVYMSRKFESFERINSIRETNGNLDSCNSCKRLGTSRLHESPESKFPFVSRIEFIRSKLSNFLLMYTGSRRTPTEAAPRTGAAR